LSENLTFINKHDKIINRAEKSALLGVVNPYVFRINVVNALWSLLGTFEFSTMRKQCFVHGAVGID
jgi:hypothetical protein